jgi:hypothetical protein
VVYLAVVGSRGATAKELEEAIWPDRSITAASRRVAVARVRRWLGRTPWGSPWLPSAMPDRTYRLSGGYLLDWDLFQRLRARAEQGGASGAEDLHQALGLVRAAPLLHAEVAHHCSSRNPYRWLPSCGLRPSRLASAIVDTAHRLAEVSLGAGDIRTARWAVQRAVDAADSDRLTDFLWLDLVRITATAGCGSELRDVLDQLSDGRVGKVLEAPGRVQAMEQQLRELAGDDSPRGSAYSRR